MTWASTDAPLAGLRIVDTTTGEVAQVTRLLADLGAEVVRVEPAGGCGERRLPPLIDSQSVAFALHNANKRSVILDASDDGDREQFLALVSGADIIVDSGNPGQASAFGVPVADLAHRYEHLVAMLVTDFGTQGPRSHWRANDAVLVAMSSVLCRSGAPDGPPVLPPAGIASSTAAAQAAWAVLVAYFHRLRTGRGEYVDFARYDAVLQALDPPFGAQGQAAAARGLSTARRGRPKNQDSYPIFASRDGWVRICILAPRQWRAMRAWLGEPAEFQDVKYDSISARAADFDKIRTLIARLFARHSGEQLVAEGAARGVPVAAILTPAEVMECAHFNAVSAWTDAAITDESIVTVPDGCVVVDGVRAGVRWLAGRAGSSEPVWPERPVTVAAAEATARPLEGVTILDLGVIVAGGELGRLFADMGAEVIKIESPSYPDGLRQARPGQIMSESFAWTHRNQMALGLDLRADGGAELFSRLVVRADAVFANFKPGTLCALGFSFSQLQEINPRLVLTESSAFGDNGPWSSRLGYGPLVRAATGITQLWATEDPPRPDSPYPFSDAVTVFPDHLVARLAAIATLAALIRRRRTGVGAQIHISQAETAVSQLDALYTTSWARARGTAVTEDLTLHGVYPCAGDDEWCVVTVGSDHDWNAVVKALEAAGLDTDPRFGSASDRWEHRAELHSALQRFTRRHDAHTLAETLQQTGVAAAPMLRGSDIIDEPQVRSRGLYAEMTHPLFDVRLPTETGPAQYRRIPPAELRPAPLLGENTVDVCRRHLQMDDAAVERLIAAGVLYAPPAPASIAEESLA
ncbi:CaiB/BaiF CoA-transferase family protein [Mycolicibacterium aichiense]|uniref:CoA-transferase n=1 Tax=Mycolicibacterium aichiense TaxID=1799 RepID=A0AAD1HRG4_9MYCO|nr:CoA transferase [Mycolicibacterium aichiense]BBX09308.1 putative CoA-transferase [Mycolicibacterium aichiense]SUA13874.1 acyl-CoA transferase/dehydratase [Mycolicibacterium aichiense]